MKKVTIIGAGFAALSAAKRLRKGDVNLDITLIAPRPEFIYLPSLIWIPNGLRKAQDLRIDLGNFFRRHRINYHQGSATGLEAGGRRVLTDTGPVENDALLIACGGRFIKKLPGIEHAITPCEGIAAAEAIRDRLAAMQGGTIAIGFAGNPNEPASMRGGPMFEFLFGIDTQLRREGRRERFDLCFFSPAPQPGNRLGPKAVQGLLNEMHKRNISTHLGHKLQRFEADKVVTEGGEVPADLILFMPGMTGNPWFDNTELPRSSGGLLQADNLCRVPGWELVYVAGDAGSFPGPDWMPKQAHMADLQAVAAADNILAELGGQTPTKGFKIELVCIVDSQNKGTLIGRNEKYSLMLPPCRLMHWLKRAFEFWYLRGYR
jgi:sulfide:quinone oxidoreductase